MIALIGLGNPEKKYEQTRHNVGFLMADHLRNEWSFVAWDKKPKLKSLIAKGTVNGVSVILVKPQTYMNNSGKAVQTVASFFDISPDDIWVMHDELDLPFGSFKIQKDRGSASHNGVESILQQLGTKAFSRVRIGVSPFQDKRPQNSHDFVLKKFSFFERRKLKTIFNNVQASLEQNLQ